MFDEQAGVTFGEDLGQEDQPRLSKELMTYNNFGICAQQTVQGKNEGLARVKAAFTVYDYINGPGKVLESEFAEIAVYNSLRSVAPTYEPYLGDLLSANQLGQEFQTFENLYKDWVFNMEYGNSIKWVVTGGTNFWQAQLGNYRTSWDTSQGGVVSVSKINELTAEFAFAVGCEATEEKESSSQRASLNLEQSSRQTRTLLRPATHRIAVEVACHPPAALRLLWAQEQTLFSANQPRELLPKSRIISNQRTHFVLVDSQHYVRHVTLDAEHQVSFNHSSVIANVVSSDPTMASVHLMPQSRGDYLADSRDSSARLHEKRMVRFSNITGTVELTASAQYYMQDSLWASKSSGGLFSKRSSAGRAADKFDDPLYAKSVTGDAVQFAETPIADKLTIEVVRNVDVGPKYKSLYIGASPQTYKLRIMHGSGQFSVTLNDTALAGLSHKDRDILITPKALGSLTIRVEDLEIPESEIASAEIRISDIARLTLWSPRTLIEQGDSMELTVSAFDSAGAEFDADQYALMTFDIETEMSGLLRAQGLQTVPQRGDNRKFTASGNEKGVFQSTAYVYRFPFIRQAMGGSGEAIADDTRGGKPTVVSEMLRIEVFPLLEIIPNNLLITPNMKYTLQIVGGPQTTSRAQQADGSHIEIKFEIEESDIASVDQFREVTGHRVGDATLKYEIIQLRSQQTSPLSAG